MLFIQQSNLCLERHLELACLTVACSLTLFCRFKEKFDECCSFCRIWNSFEKMLWSKQKFRPEGRPGGWKHSPGRVGHSTEGEERDWSAACLAPPSPISALWAQPEADPCWYGGHTVYFCHTHVALPIPGEHESEAYFKTKNIWCHFVFWEHPRTSLDQGFVCYMLNLLQGEHVWCLILWEISTQDATSCRRRREGKGAECWVVCIMLERRQRAVCKKLSLRTI